MATNQIDEPIRDIAMRLQRACNSFDDETAKHAAQELIAEIHQRTDPIDAAEAAAAMRLLRRRRLFKSLEQLGDALVLSGQHSPTVRCLYAQSQLDQGNLSSAMRVLEELRADYGPTGSEPDGEVYAETEGLMGRARKQQYVDAGQPEIERHRRNIAAAIEHYYSIFAADNSKIWHGINAFALLTRAAHDEVPIDGFDNEAPVRIGQQIEDSLRNLDAKQELTAWALATGVELYCGLALNTHDAKDCESYTQRALDYVSKYGLSENADAFELASTLRQLREVWVLDPESDPGRRLLPALEVALLSRTGGSVTTAAPEFDARLQSGGLEKVFGTDGFVSPEWVSLCQRRLRSVCRISRESGDPVGTGFLVSGGELSPALSGQNFVLTNSHVVSADRDGSLWPPLPVVSFEAVGVTASITEVIWQSPRSELDASLLAIEFEGTDSPKPIDALGRVPEAGKFGGRRTFIIGHPLGNRVSISLHDNHLLDLDDRVLHYRTPTQPGSSGSPVFDEHWNLIGLHRAGTQQMDRLNGQSGKYQANEGVRIDRIRAAVNDAFDDEQIDLTAATPAAMGTPHGRRRLRNICDLGLGDLDVLDPDELQPGDILVFRANNNRLSKLITSLDGYWSHSAIYVGGGDVAHSYTAGIGLMSFETITSHYDEGYAVARPNRTEEQRNAAADYARRIAATPDTEYSGRDLGLAFALLARVRIREFLDSLRLPPEATINDEGLGAFFQRAEVEKTCSGFVYSCYAGANGGKPGPLAVVPAPGIALRDGLLSVRSNLEAMTSPAEATDPADMSILAAAMSLGDDDLESLARVDWAALKPKLDMFGGAGIAILQNIFSGDEIPIEAGVTPADLWCSPEIADRWFLTHEGQKIAKIRSEDCRQGQRAHTEAQPHARTP